MSPVGYSLAVLSSSRLRFADLFNGGAVFGWGQQEKTSTSQPLAGGQLLPSSKPATMRVFYSGTDTQSGWQGRPGDRLVSGIQRPCAPSARMKSP